MIAGAFFYREELLLNQSDLGAAVDPADASRSTVAMRLESIETSRSCQERLIGNGGFRCVHVDCVR